MTRIEISLKEYNELKETIKTLEEKNLNGEKALNELSRINSELYNELQEIVEGAAFFDRVFKWNKTIQNAKNIIEKYG